MEIKPRFRNLSLTRRLDRFVHEVTDDKHQLEASTTKLVELLLSEYEIVKASNGEYLLLELVPCTEGERKESRRVVTSVPITDKTFENLSILREVLNMHASTALRLIHLLGV